MGLNREAAKNYGVSVLKRATGRDVYEQWQKYVDTVEYNNITRSMHENKRSTGLIEGAVQIAFPFWMDAASRVARAEQKINPFIAMGKSMPSLITEFVTWNYLILPMAMQHPLEAVAVKAVVNLATPVVMDLAAGAMDRISKFRPPSAATLAI